MLELHAIGGKITVMHVLLGQIKAICLVTISVYTHFIFSVAKIILTWSENPDNLHANTKKQYYACKFQWKRHERGKSRPLMIAFGDGRAVANKKWPSNARPLLICLCRLRDLNPHDVAINRF